jgi:hypothetical protein
MALRQILDSLIEYINDDTVEDALMRSAVRRAVRWAERNYTFKYMETYSVGTISVPAAGAIPDVISFGFGAALKCTLEEDARVYRANQPRTRWRFRQISYDDFMSYLPGPPRCFFLVGATGYCPTSVVTEEYKAEIPVAVYSVMDMSNDDLTHWMFINGEDFVVYKAATYVAAALRDMELRQTAGQDADTALKTLLDADFDLRQGTRLEIIGYANELPEEEVIGEDTGSGTGGGSGSTWADGSVWDDGSAWADG